MHWVLKPSPPLTLFLLCNKQFYRRSSLFFPLVLPCLIYRILTIRIQEKELLFIDFLVISVNKVGIFVFLLLSFQNSTQQKESFCPTLNLTLRYGVLPFLFFPLQRGSTVL